MVAQRKVISKPPGSCPLGTEFVGKHLAGGSGHHQVKGVDVFPGESGNRESGGK
jgi:hypothetical protein